MPSRAKKLSPQPWPWPGKRVLLEIPDGAVGLASASALREAGFAVGVCPGPAGTGECPLVGPDGCALVDGADVIVSALGLDRPEGREVVEALRAQYPGTPLVVEAPAGEAGRYRDLLAGCDVIVSTAESKELAAAVRGALASTSV